VGLSQQIRRRSADAQQSLVQLAMLGRLTRDLPRFLRKPIDPEQAAVVVRRRLAARPERFLTLADRLIYRNPRSPYLRLLRAAGCERGDLQTLVRHEGIEGALHQLAERGVYVSFEEFKGHREIVRGSLRFAPSDADFDHPFAAPHIERRTGGTRSQGTLVRMALSYVAELAPSIAVTLQAHGLSRADQAIWQTASLMQLLRFARVGLPPVAWFHPVQPLPSKVRAVATCLRLYGRVLGCSLPGPAWSDAQSPHLMVAWLRDRVAAHGPICLTCYASSAVRVCATALARGISLSGVCFIVLGEPFTEAKRRVVEAAGAQVVVNYSAVEANTIAYGCAAPTAPDDLHLFTDSYAVIGLPRPVGGFGVEVDAFHLTSLLPSAPKVLLNVENGDYGTIARRDCTCFLGSLGLRDHLSYVRSHEKLTGEGMTFVKTRLVEVVEDVLPARFGGASTDYQVIEEETGDGLMRLSLLVSPGVGEVDPDDVRAAFLEEIGRGTELERYMARFWELANTVQVERRPPRATGVGKVLPFHLIRASR